MSAIAGNVPEIDQDAAKVLAAMQAANRPAMETLTPEQGRKAFAMMREAMKQPKPEMAAVKDIAAKGPAGDIPMRLYRSHAAGTSPSPVLVFYHGGGWVLGDLESHDIQCRHFANAGACSVIAVDYRLAPEHRFPAAADDCIAATRWVAGNAAELGVAADRLAVGGDSAGGNLAAVVALDAAANGGPAVKAQVLIYPTVDLRMEYDSYSRVGAGYTLTAPSMAWFRDHYLGGQDLTDWRASPLLASNHGDAPPALVLTAGLDPLCDEGQAYAQALKAAGVDVEFECYSGQMHGFIGASGVIGQTDTAIAQIGAFLKKRLA